MPRVAFVASLPHSGSTLLDLLLATHPDAVGVGEVPPVLGALRAADSRLAHRPCACGAVAADCPVWSRVLADPDATTNLAALYRVLLDAVAAAHPGTLVVDSSKVDGALTALVRTEPDVAVVRLTRDVRSWATSMRSVARTRPLRDGPRAALWSHLRRTTPGLFRWWYQRNRALDDVVASLGVTWMPLGYEELATAPDAALRLVAALVGIDPAFSHDTSAATTHQLFGSTMRFDPELRSTVRYDTRWMTDDRVMLPGAVLRPVMHYNRRRVYANSPMARWGLERPAGSQVDHLAETDDRTASAASSARDETDPGSVSGS